MNGIRLRVIVGDENHAVRADAVIIVRRHLEVIAALDLSEKRARHFAVFVLAQAVVIAEGRRRVKRIALAGGDVLPFHAVDVGARSPLSFGYWE